MSDKGFLTDDDAIRGIQSDMTLKVLGHDQNLHETLIPNSK
jgi:hypothetical protein